MILYCIMKAKANYHYQRGVLYMGLMFTTVIGFMVCMGISALFIMRSLQTAFIASDASTIDPKPENKF